MIAAIYARKSTDQSIADDEKSVTRQVERGRADAERKGWTVDPEQVYVDDGVSGADFVKRAGFLRLMNALRPRPAFQILVMMEQSLLGRSLDEVPYALRRISEAGVRVFFYLMDQEVKRDTAVDRFQASVMAFVDETHREQSRQCTRDAMRRRAEQGHVAGGRVYGYRNRGVRVGDRRSHVERTIELSEADVVRGIFGAVARGDGFNRIAKALNAAAVPAPYPDRGGWAVSGVREIVGRELYRGRQVYGRTRWEDRGGTKRKVDTPPSEWIAVELPALRIVDEVLWSRAHTRLDETRARYARLTNGRLVGRPGAAIDSPYLLTGFLACGLCGGSVFCQAQTSKRGGRSAYYVCARHRQRGTCPGGGLRIRREPLEAAVLDAIERAVLSPERLAEVIDRAAARLAAAEQAVPDRRASGE